MTTAEGWREAGEAVAMQRGRCHWTREELAKRAHVDESTIRDLEKGVKRERGVNTLAAIADALGWEPDQIQRIAAGEPPPWRTKAERDEAIERQLEELAGLVDEVTTLRAVVDQLVALGDRVVRRLDRIDPPGA
jgi:transcriptional regulator with XRE-family HTH domain